ncbi:MFS_DIRC2 domain containing protein [Burkholderiales bacterium]
MDFTTVLEIGFIAAIAAVTLYFHLRFDRFSVSHGPEVLTTMGILGCFTGITIALFSFDPNNIQQSVPSLLGGIRTAFWASLAGVLGALTLRFAQRFRPLSEANESEKSEAEVIDVVRAIDRMDRRQAEDQNRLLVAFQDFSQHMVENNQKAVVEALKEVVRDFNQQLTEQFGENFKQLNSAVENLVTWQQQYRETLEQLQAEQQKSQLALAQAGESLANMAQSAGHFAQTAHALESEIAQLTQTRERLFAQEEALARLLETLREVTPTFAAKADDMLSEISSGMTKVTREIADRMLESHREMRQLVSGTAQSTEQQLARVQSAMTRAADSLAQSLETAQLQAHRQMLDQLSEHQTLFKQELQAQSQIVKQSVLALDIALQKELESALQSLAGQLAALSNRFVEDYTPLTQRLRELVDVSKRI